MKSFYHEIHAKGTRSSKEYWEIKMGNFTQNIDWTISEKYPQYILSKKATCG